MRCLFSHVPDYLIMECNILVTKNPYDRLLGETVVTSYMSHIYSVLGRDSYCHRPYNRFLLYDVCCRRCDRCDTIFRQDWSCFLVICTIVKSWFNFRFLNFRSLNHNFFNFKFLLFQISSTSNFNFKFQLQPSNFNFKFRLKLKLQFQISSTKISSTSNFDFNFKL